jgi:small subunit ribosomal protein S2
LPRFFNCDILNTNMEAITKKQVKNKFGLKTEEMAEAGLYFGHRVSGINPKIKPYLEGVRNNVHIFDLEKTAEKFSEALEFIQKTVSEKKKIILVGTKIQIKDLVEKTGEECGIPYVNRRWLGGTFTNFEVIKKRIDYFKELEEKKKTGELEKYTKKERVKIDKEIEDLHKKLEGLKTLEKLPEAVFICDLRKDELAAKEAGETGIKVIAITDTNVNPELADFPIPANDDAISSVKYILEKVAEVIKKCKKPGAK